MADDEAKEEEESKKESGISMGKLIIVIVVLFALFGGAGVFAFVKFVLPKMGTSQEAVTGEIDKEKEEKKEGSKWVGPIHPLSPFVVNLAQSGGRRFLKVTVELELGSSDMSDEMEKRKPQIRDTVITMLSNKTFDDIYTVHGKYKAREELKRRLNSYLEKGQIVNIYFTEFVIQ